MLSVVDYFKKDRFYLVFLFSLKILSSKIFDLNKGRNELEFLETNLQQFVIYKITIDNEIHVGKWIIIEN